VTTPPTPDPLDRLFTTLVATIRDERPEYLGGAFEVGELLAFVPYKKARAALGVDTNDDYAHAITRLLAGEAGYVFVDDLMQDDLQAELKSPNPDLVAYRAYLTSRITLAQARVREALDRLGPPAAAPEPPTDAPAPPPAPAEPVTASAAPPKAPPPARPAAAPPRPAAPVMPLTQLASPPGATRERPIVAKPRALPDATAPVEVPESDRASRPGCKYCGQVLPQGRDVRFCPHCGQDLAVRRCPACSAEVEPGWKFCVTCGRATTA
jgi:predicted RNA-binding Zn-ribbon protein involved in translation (DUF1610 family)